MSWQNEMKEKYQKLLDYTRDVEAKLGVAKDRLVTISAGMHYTNEVQDTWTGESKARHTAAVGLKKISDMRQRERPILL